MRASHLLISAALAACAGSACAQGPNGSARIDGTGAGSNAGVGSDLSGKAISSPGGNNASTSGTGESADDTRVLGSGRMPQGNIVPDNLPGTMLPPGNATVGINGTGTLDGSVPAGGVDVTRELRDEVQR